MHLQRLLEEKDAFSEDEVKNILKYYNIPVPKFQIVDDIEKIELSIQFPVAVKVCSPHILHKTDVGGVELDIRNMEELYEVLKEFKKNFPDAKFLIEEMQRKGIEVIAGLINDKSFGMSIMVGMGGIFAEIYKDISFRLVPIERENAEEMLEDLKAWKIFKGFRGMEVNVDSLIDLLLKLSKFGEEYGKYINQMDLNPVFLYKDGLVVIDAKLMKGE
ncbi:acetyl-CoA synthetase [Thermoplasmatales archaeon ex4484_30]|nr:MAG: acetyl-CoA synthetase [Thermoplasmatales archaeon ex4484_30]